MTEVDGSGVAAIIVGSGTAIAAVIGALRLQRGAKKAETEKPVKPPIAAVPLPNTRDPDDVLKFLAVIQADNVSLRGELSELREWKALTERAMAEMSDELKISKGEQVRFRDAFGRYLVVLFRDWGKGERPPLPVGDDLVVLRDIIPRG